MSQRNSEVASKFLGPVAIAAAWTVANLVMVRWAFPEDFSKLLPIEILLWMGLGVTIGGVSAARQSSREAREHKAAQERKDEQSRQRVAQLAGQLRETIPHRIVTEYESAVTQLEYAEPLVDVARQLYAQRVFTPFWEAIENGFSALNRHRLHVNQVGSLINEYMDTYGQLAALDPHAAADVDSFPPALRSATQVPVGEHLSGLFQDLAFKAQSDYEFASIFEQRRTTSAVIEGFRSMNDAVSRMGASISRAVADLGRGIDSLALQSKEIAANSSRLIEATNEVGTAVKKSSEIHYGFGSGHTVGGQLVEINRRLEELGRRH